MIYPVLMNAVRRVRNRFEFEHNSPSEPREIKTIAVCAPQVPFFRGGAELHVEALVRQLKSRGYEVDLITIPYRWYPHNQLFKNIKIWQDLDLTEFNGKAVDLVIATKFPSYFIQHPRKVVWLIHQYRQIYDLLDTPFSGFDMARLKDKRVRDKLVAMDTVALKSFPHRFSNSKNTANRLLRFNGLEARALYHPPPLCESLKCTGYNKFLLSVGRLDKLKRIDLLLKAMPHIDESIRCKIAGVGPENEFLHQLAKDLGVVQRVDFLGHVSDCDLIQLYGECSAVFFAPLDEDYGYITLEAFLSKKPVITSFDSGGPLEFVHHQSNGLILSLHDPAATGCQINNLLNNKQVCIEYGERGYQMIRHIAWDPAINALLGE